jgi:uncharacterized protein (DUF697 family)
MQMPVNIRDLLNSSKELLAEKDQPVQITVLVDAEAPDALIDAMRDALTPQRYTAVMRIEAIAPGDVPSMDSATEAVIAVAGPGDTLAHTLASIRDRYIPCAVVALGHGGAEVSRRLGHPIADTLVEQQPDVLVHELGRWLADRMKSKRTAIASNFVFARRAVAEEAVKATAAQNAAVGFMAVIPGADMPVMTANQAKMVLQIAAAYGEEMGAERIKELAGVIGGGFAMRTVARQIVGLVPALGWAAKAAIGYSGTLAMGYAAIEYFECGGDVRGLGARIAGARDHAVNVMARRGSKSGPREYITSPASDRPGRQVEKQ